MVSRVAEGRTPCALARGVSDDNPINVEGFSQWIVELDGFLLSFPLLSNLELALQSLIQIIDNVLNMFDAH